MSDFDHGTVICGTLLPYDLIETFANEVRLLAPDSASTESLLTEAAMVLADGREQVNHPTSPARAEQNGELISELIDKINEHCPEGTYFGTHPGDGADFGYFPTEADDG